VSLRALPLSLLGLAVGWGAGRWGAPHLLAALSASSLSRTNYRRRVVVAGLGLLLPLGLLAWAAPLAVANRLAPVRADQIGVAVSQTTLAVVIAGLAFALLGLIDDLADDGSVRGFRGHLGALAAGRLTGGGAKLLGGGLAALVVATLAVESPRWLVIPATILVASAANVANLFDLRPGRCAKVFLPLWVLGAIIAPGPGAWSAGLAGASLGVLPNELREEGMLGDSGANALGAVAGALVATGPVWLVLTAAAVLLALQLASERISFTKVIEANRWLRAVDRLGRLPD
jgi:UDP-N-acetylmuramyl pentapeptide phosphotransferase/UDP-N-acetylglucosamine-1-phosphate transferase